MERSRKFRLCVNRLIGKFDFDDTGSESELPDRDFDLDWKFWELGKLKKYCHDDTGLL